MYFRKIAGLLALTFAAASVHAQDSASTPATMPDAPTATAKHCGFENAQALADFAASDVRDLYEEKYSEAYILPDAASYSTHEQARTASGEEPIQYYGSLVEEDSYLLSNQDLFTGNIQKNNSYFGTFSLCQAMAAATKNAAPVFGFYYTEEEGVYQGEVYNALFVTIDKIEAPAP